MNRHLATSFMMALLVLAASDRASGAQDQPPHTAIFTETGMRAQIKEAWMPVYPDEALKAGAQGEVVVAVLFNEDGSFGKAAVLESPHPTITAALLDVLKQWKTLVRHTERADGPYQAVGWLTFSFEIRDGKGYVSYETHSPDDKKLDRRFVNPLIPRPYGPIYYRYESGVLERGAEFK